MSIPYPACPHCGCTDIALDAIARWNPETAAWEISGTLDTMTCDECGEEFDEADWFTIDLDKPEEKTNG
jgi:predicted nucleic-acid-binding Zn-ribbon protein